MPTIHVSKKALEKYLGKSFAIDKLLDRISYLGTDLEGIEGDEITIETFPNRPDLLSTQGLARALSSFLGIRTGLKEYKAKKSNHKVIIENSVKKYRPFTACAIVKGLKFDDERIKEIIEFQEKLHITYGRNRKKVAIGIYPFEKIKPPIRFIAQKPNEIRFVPLESEREMTGSQILQNHPTGREYAHLLEGLDKYPLFVDANNQVLSMPPIINSHTVGKITENTTEVFIECSGFDFEVLSKCLNMIVTSLADMGGEIYSMELQYGTKKITTPELKPSTVKVDIEYLNKRLGLELKQKEIKRLAESMGYEYKEGRVKVPAYRSDVMHQVDVIEDIAIAYGYEAFKEEIPNVATVGEEDPLQKFRRKLAGLLVGFGLSETSTFHLINKEDLIEKMLVRQDSIWLEKPSSTEYNMLRSWLLPSLMQVLRFNKHHEYPQKLFEIGTVFQRDSKTETGISESMKLAILSAHGNANFTELKQYLDFLLKVIGIEYVVEELEHPSFIEGRVGRIRSGKNPLGIIGELKPEVLNNFGIEMPAAALEVDIEQVFELSKKE